MGVVSQEQIQCVRITGTPLSPALTCSQRKILTRLCLPISSIILEGVTKESLKELASFVIWYYGL